MTYETLTRISLKISEILSLYIETNEIIRFPQVTIEPYKVSAHLVYVTLEGYDAKLLSVVSEFDLFTDIRELCREWNELVHNPLKEVRRVYGC